MREIIAEAPGALGKTSFCDTSRLTHDCNWHKAPNVRRSPGSVWLRLRRDTAVSLDVRHNTLFHKWLRLKVPPPLHRQVVVSLMRCRRALPNFRRTVLCYCEEARQKVTLSQVPYDHPFAVARRRRVAIYAERAGAASVNGKFWWKREKGLTFWGEDHVRPKPSEVRSAVT